jgi:uncharacterized OB-fold protein
MNSAGTSDRAQDWYSVLGLAAAATTEEIGSAVERLTRQASALALTAPERSRQLREQARAIKLDLLSGEAQRQHYDQDLASRSRAGYAAAPGNLAVTGDASAAQTYPPPGQAQAYPPASAAPAAEGYPPASVVPPGQAYPSPTPVPPGQAYPPPTPVPPGQAYPPAGPGNRPAQRAASRIARFLQTGWTCPTCGHGALPAEKFCQKCGTRIQAIASPPAGSAQSDVTAQSAIRSAACANCGASLPSGHAFCTRCGTRRA